MATTMQDVAAAAGVSRATVSLAFRGDTRIPHATVERVRTAAEQLGYVYNGAAARLRSGRSRVVGLIVPDLRNPFIANMLAGIDAACEERDHTVMIASSGESAARQHRAITAMLEHGVDGILLIAARDTTADDLRTLTESRVPVVEVTRRVPGVTVPYVGADNVEAARLACRHLLEIGHRTIAFAGGHLSSSARIERLRGIHLAHKSVGAAFREELDFPSNVSMRAGFEMAHSLPTDLPAVTAVICYNDVVALGFLRGLADCGRRAGADFSVMGFDDTDEAALSDPGLSTVGVSPSRIGSEAIRLLFDTVAGVAGDSILMLPPRMVLRDSTAAPHRVPPK
ncbi:MAG: LacI family transcriptional regulator [Spirochaetaceae bacterium]|nr:MAG: LacI family transcriptional regulator [Spirochaetaceae bacterium]